MIQLFKKFSHIISTYKISAYQKEKNLYKFNARIIFNDFSILEIKDYRFSNGERKYSYHWMTKKEKLIIRWDNASHWEDISTYPHHKHNNSTNNIQPSLETNLENVLKFIDTKQKEKFD